MCFYVDSFFLFIATAQKVAERQIDYKTLKQPVLAQFEKRNT